MSQTQLAAAADLHAPDISKFENGVSRPYPSQAERLSRVLQVPADQLLEPADAA